MPDRLIDISSPAKLSVQLERLMIEQKDHDPVAVPFDEIAAVVISNNSVLFTHAVLSSLAQAGAAFVVCTEKHLPAGMLLPLESHHAQREVFGLQSAMKLPQKKKLWKQIVQAKISAQASLLEFTSGSTHGLSLLGEQVRSGDSTNAEAHAAKQYWGALFGKGFRRDSDDGGVNAHLNYGYAIVRGIVARSICAAGLHPSLSLHHHNRYDAFALADDLMEPFRPIVDCVVWTMRGKGMVSETLSQEGKRQLLAILTLAYPYTKGERRTLFDICAKVASSLANVVRGDAHRLELPTSWEFGMLKS